MVAATTSDPAKTLGRLWPGSKERYYAVRRRKTTPGPLVGVDARGEVPHDRVVARTALAKAQHRGAATAACAVRPVERRLPARRPSPGARRGGRLDLGIRFVRRAHDRRARRRFVGDDLDVPRRAPRARRRVAGSPLARRLLRARDEPAEHARAGGRGQGDGPGRLRSADRRRRQSAAPVGDRQGWRDPYPMARPCAARAAGARCTGGYANEQFAYRGAADRGMRAREPGP